jgi:hypothetical protein
MGDERGFGGLSIFCCYGEDKVRNPAALQAREILR